MKPYIFSILFCILTSISIAQTKEVILKKSYKVDKNTILNLDLDNVAIIFEESFDDKIHFDYSMIFGRYSNRKREMIKNQTKVKTTHKNGLLTLNVKNSEFLGINLLYYPEFTPNFKTDSVFISMKDFIKKEKERKGVYKTKDSILNEIGFSEGSYLTDFLKRTNNSKSRSSIKNKKVIIKKFVVKLPKYMKLRVKSINSNLTFNYDITQPLLLNSFKGTFKFKNILAKENRIIASNGIFQAKEIHNGRMEFLDMYKVVIGEVSNISFATETSRIQIGEIGKNVDLNDFNSKLYLYNFSKNFTKFNLKGDYSELNLYNITKSNFSMDVFGHNTTLNMNETKTSFGLSKDKKLDKILEKKVKENKVSQGNIAIELKNGILNIK